MHGAPLVDIESANRFKACLEDAVKGLSEALLVAEAGCSADEFLEIRTLIGDLIARVDGLLHESVHEAGLREMAAQPSGTTSLNPVQR
jgi:hypothetical protein